MWLQGQRPEGSRSLCAPVQNSMRVSWQVLHEDSWGKGDRGKLESPGHRVGS